MGNVNMNFEIPEDLHKEAKVKSAIKGITLKEYITKLIEKDVKTK